MKTSRSPFVCIPATLSLALLIVQPVAAADSAVTPPTTASTSSANESVSQQLYRIVDAVSIKLDKGATKEADLAPEMKQFDDLFAAHKNEKTDTVAEILYAKAELYVEILDSPDKALPILQQLKTDFPDTEHGKMADQRMAAIAEQGAENKIQAAANKIQSALAVGTKLPDFNVTDVEGKPLSIAGDKGKVILIDFWATWCGPCVEEFPNVLTTYTKYHEKGFDIIGISLDSDKTPLTKFIQDKNVTWPQFFDGKQWQNELAVKYGINSIPATYLLDSQGNIIGKNLRGDELEKAVAAALAK